MPPSLVSLGATIGPVGSRSPPVEPPQWQGDDIMVDADGYPLMAEMARHVQMQVDKVGQAHSQTEPQVEYSLQVDDSPEVDDSPQARAPEVDDSHQAADTQAKPPPHQWENECCSSGYPLIFQRWIEANPAQMWEAKAMAADGEILCQPHPHPVNPNVRARKLEAARTMADQVVKKTSTKKKKMQPKTNTLKAKVLSAARKIKGQESQVSPEKSAKAEASSAGEAEGPLNHPLQEGQKHLAVGQDKKHKTQSAIKVIKIVKDADAIVMKAFLCVASTRMDIHANCRMPDGSNKTIGITALLIGRSANFKSIGEKLLAAAPGMTKGQVVKARDDMLLAEMEAN